MKHLKKVISAILAILLGAILAEIFLRVLIPVEAQFETWFTPGIEQWDDDFGAVYRPGWKGTMRHVDGVYRGVPLELNEYGHRLPARNEVPGTAKRILLMGGRSAMMSYGLADWETVHARMAQSMEQPVEARTIASAGGNLLRDWIQYRKHLMDENWDLVILSHVNPYLPAYSNHEAFDILPEPPPPEWVFHYMDGIVLWRDGLFLKTGRAAFRSYLGYGFVRLADTFIKRFSEKGSKGTQGMAEVIARQAEAPDPKALSDYIAFLEHISAHFEDRGIPVMVHLIPRPFAEEDQHAPYREALSRRLDVVDMQQKMHRSLSPELFIANGHYGPELARELGEALSVEVSARLSKENP